MALEIIRNVNVDFHDTEYIIVNAKQYDDASRIIAVTCYNQGSLYHINETKHSVYVKFKRPDKNVILNFCEISNRGEVMIELTEQMLSNAGMCEVELVIVNKGKVRVNVNTGEIIAIDDSPILSTMAFYVNVYETSADNSEFEDSYEFNALNDLLKKAEADYNRIIMFAKSYAVGNAGGIRDNEDTENAEYYYKQSIINASKAKASEDNAKASETASKTSETNAKSSEVSAKNSETNASTSETNAANSEAAAKESEDKSKISETNAANSEAAAKESETNADISETNAANSASAAAASEANAATSEANAKKYEADAKDSLEIVKSVVNGLNSGFIPVGTISFSELATAEKATGFTYNISDDFVTDDSFVEGAGKAYTAGTNVYYTIGGYWDCFGGTALPTATVAEVREYLGI